MSLDCAVIEQEEMVRAYVVDDLTAEDALAFEAHYFACDRCWQDVQRALEVRAALESTPAQAEHEAAPVPGRLTGTSRTWWPWLAAAATLVLAVALWSAVPSSPPPQLPQPAETLRGSGDAGPAVTAVRGADGAIQIDWPVNSRAASYVLKVFGTDGTTVLTREVKADTVSLTLSAQDLTGRPADERLYTEIEAIEVLGVVIASSEQIQLPGRAAQRP